MQNDFDGSKLDAVFAALGPEAFNRLSRDTLWDAIGAPERFSKESWTDKEQIMWVETVHTLALIDIFERLERLGL